MSQNWFGSGDLFAFTGWTALFGVGIACLATALDRVPPARRGPGAIVGIFVGALAWNVWTLVVAMMLGPWFRAWSAPVLRAWVAGGAFGLGLRALVLSSAPNIRLDRSAHA